MPLRDAGSFSAPYDLAAMKRGLAAEGGEFTVFGGEPLLMPFDDLADLLRWGHARHGRTGVQTNGALITPRHLALFAECRTSVGISLDGPGALNDSRWAGSLEKTRAATAAAEAAVAALCAGSRPPSLIVTLHRGNAGPAQLPALCAWLAGLARIGVRSVRLHALEIDHPEVRDRLRLDDAAQVAALFAIRDACARDAPALQLDVFADMTRLLLGEGETSCVWNACDPLTTPAVRGVSAAGGRTNCSRTNKDGVDWEKADGHGSERLLALAATPQAEGGCAGCRYLLACKGQCPGTAIDGDWRNRSEQCAVWYGAFARLEAELAAAGRVPVTADPARRAAAERRLLDRARRGLGGPQGHGDHWDAPDGYDHGDGPQAVHGDAGTTTTHGDAPHGDHSDAA